MLIVTMISIRTHLVRHTGFILIVFSLPDSGVSSENLVFSRYGCQKGRGEGVLHVSKERGGGGGGADKPFRTMYSESVSNKNLALH